MELVKTLTLLLNVINEGGQLATLGMEAYAEIKKLGGLSDADVENVWIQTGEANKVEIARRRLEIAGLLNV
jgi:hypothetical protein